MPLSSSGVYLNSILTRLFETKILRTILPAVVKPSLILLYLCNEVMSPTMTIRAISLQ